MQYAFLLTQRGKHELAIEILRHILFSTVYQTNVSQDTLRLAIISESSLLDSLCYTFKFLVASMRT